MEHNSKKLIYSKKLNEIIFFNLFIFKVYEKLILFKYKF